MIRSVERFEGYPRALMELSRVVLLMQEKRRDDAIALFQEVSEKYGDDEIVQYHLKMVIAKHKLAPSELSGRRRVDQGHAAIRGRKFPWAAIKKKLVGRG